MVARRRRTLPATELRVHLGAALRALAEEDIVIEKGGVPVALLTAYRPAAAEAGGAETAYTRSLSRAAEPGGWERMDAAMAAGWTGIEPEELVANVYRWRAEGGMTPLRSLAATDDEADATEGAAEGR